MIQFVICSEITGEINGDCPYCGIYGVSDEDFGGYPVPEGHMKYKLDSHRGEDIKIYEVDQARGAYRHRVNPRTKKLERRGS